MDVGQRHLVILKNSAAKLVKEHGGIRVNGAVASIRTQQMTLEVVLTCCERLWALGFQLRDIRGLTSVHIKSLVEDWVSNEYSPKTIQNYISRLRRVGVWIGKPDMIPNRLVYTMYPEKANGILKISKIAEKSKSWSEQGIDVVAKIHEADKICLRFGAMLRLGVAFGLRRKEQLRAKPRLMDAGNYLLIRQNMAKSGKDRDIPIDHPFQRVCLEHAKRLCRSKDDFLGWPNKTYEQNINRYNYLMRCIGITGSHSDCVGHGLRAEYAENISLLYGIIPPVLGGMASQADDDARLAIQNLVSKNMGHHRPEVTGAYYGDFRISPRPQ